MEVRIDGDDNRWKFWLLVIMNELQTDGWITGEERVDGSRRKRGQKT